MTGSGSLKAGRIVVGIRPASEIDYPIEAAAILAKAVSAELVGVFVEEQAMLDVCELPFACVVSSGSPRPQPLTRRAMQQAFSHRATAVESSLAARAGSARLKWSFQRTRGELHGALNAVTGSGDILVVAGAGGGFDPFEWFEEFHTTPPSAGALMIAARRPPQAMPGPVVAIDDGDDSGAQTVTLGARIAGELDVPLMVLALAANAETANRIMHRAQELAAAAPALALHRVPPGAPEAVAAVLMHDRPSFIIADMDGEPFNDHAAARRLLRATRAPVLLLGTHGD